MIEEKKQKDFSRIKEQKFKKVTIISIIIFLFITTIITIVVFAFKPNYYYSNDFLKLSSWDKAIEILKRNGENNLNNDSNSYCIVNQYEIDELNYVYMFYWDNQESQLGMEYKLTSEAKEFKISLFLDKGKESHLLWLSGYNGSNLSFIGKATIYAPTYYSDVIINFEELHGESENQVSSFASQSLHILLTTINNLLKNYNFSIEELGFYRYF